MDSLPLSVECDGGIEGVNSTGRSSAMEIPFAAGTVTSGLATPDLVYNTLARLIGVVAARVIGLVGSEGSLSSFVCSSTTCCLSFGSIRVVFGVELLSSLPNWVVLPRQV